MGDIPARYPCLQRSVFILIDCKEVDFDVRILPFKNIPDFPFQVQVFGLTEQSHPGSLRPLERGLSRRNRDAAGGQHRAASACSHKFQHFTA